MTSKRPEQILKLYKQFIEEQDPNESWPQQVPRTRWLAEQIGTSVSVISWHLSQLVRRGYLVQPEPRGHYHLTNHIPSILIPSKHHHQTYPSR